MKQNDKTFAHHSESALGQYISKAAVVFKNNFRKFLGATFVSQVKKKYSFLYADLVKSLEMISFWISVADKAWIKLYKVEKFSTLTSKSVIWHS